MDGAGTAEDGADSLLVATLDLCHIRHLFFDDTGLLDQQVFPNPGGQMALAAQL